MVAIGRLVGRRSRVGRWVGLVDRVVLRVDLVGKVADVVEAGQSDSLVVAVGVGLASMADWADRVGMGCDHVGLLLLGLSRVHRQAVEAYPLCAL